MRDYEKIAATITCIAAKTGFQIQPNQKVSSGLIKDVIGSTAGWAKQQTYTSVSASTLKQLGVCISTLRDDLHDIVERENSVRQEWEDAMQDLQALCKF